MKIALFGPSKPDAYAQIEHILEKMPSVEILEGEQHLTDADIVFSIGGDGTFLRAASHVGASGVPILGINAGRLGFLADVQLREIKEALPEIVAGEYDVEQRSLLELEVPSCQQIYRHFSLNEVAVLKRDVSSMVSVSVYVNGAFLNQYDADGLAIATPTGSTAYAMSAGGPILEPQSDCFVIVPIAPHSLTTRPLVIRDSSTLRIEVQSRNNLFLVAIDGTPLHLTTQYHLELRKAGYFINVAHRPEHTFYDTLRQKLMWGLDARN